MTAILAIAYRDLLKFVRTPIRLLVTFLVPAMIIVALGNSLQSNLGKSLGINFLVFTFTGIFAMTLFQSSAFGIISLIEDRATDFTQEIFVSPISRYSIVFGKILGEVIVALLQGVGITLFALVIGVPLSVVQITGLLPVAVISCLLGGSFGMAILGYVTSQRAAGQVFPLLFLPQFFLAGVFNPVRRLPWALDVLSHLSPLRYTVDLTRGVVYSGQSDYSQLVLAAPLFNVAVIVAMFIAFMVVGTAAFVRQERNR